MTVRKYLRQLRKGELLELAKRKRVRMPKTWRKSKMVDTLWAAKTSQRDVLHLVSRSGTPREKGAELEKKVTAYFSRLGYKLDTNIRVEGAEFDVVGWKEVGSWWHGQWQEWVFAECKNKPKVIPQEFHKFIGKFSSFKKRKNLTNEYITAYLITTGVFDPVVKSENRRYSNVKLKRLKV